MGSLNRWVVVGALVAPGCVLPLPDGTSDGGAGGSGSGGSGAASGGADTNSGGASANSGGGASSGGGSPIPDGAPPRPDAGVDASGSDALVDASGSDALVDASTPGDLDASAAGDAQVGPAHEGGAPTPSDGGTSGGRSQVRVVHASSGTAALDVCLRRNDGGSVAPWAEVHRRITNLAFLDDRVLSIPAGERWDVKAVAVGDPCSASVDGGATIESSPGSALDDAVAAITTFRPSDTRPRIRVSPVPAAGNPISTDSGFSERHSYLGPTWAVISSDGFLRYSFDGASSEMPYWALPGLASWNAPVGVFGYTSGLWPLCVAAGGNPASPFCWYTLQWQTTEPVVTVASHPYVIIDVVRDDPPPALIVCDQAPAAPSGALSPCKTYAFRKP